MPSNWGRTDVLPLNNYVNNIKCKDFDVFLENFKQTVSKNVNYLINNDITSTSSKNLSAKKLNIPILSEEDFENLLLKK